MALPAGAIPQWIGKDMNKTLLTSCLLGTSMLIATPAFAQDASAAATNNAQIDALRQEVQQLQSRLDQMAAAQAAAPAPAPVAAPAPAPSLPGWITDTKVGGKAFIDFSSIHQKNDGVDTSQNGQQADVKRFYLTVDHRFSDIFSANLTTDMRYGSNGLTNDDVIYVKKAYIQAKFRPELWVRIGAADLPWVPFAESVYGYRFVENTLIDRLKFGTSADYGVHVGGTFGKGLVNYQVSVISGQGYKTTYRGTDTLDVEGRIDAHPIKGLTLAVGGYTGKLGKSAEPAADTQHRATRLNALAAYGYGPVKVGVEYFEEKNWSNVATNYSDKFEGWSFFGSVMPKKNFSVFGRYDIVNADRQTNPTVNQSAAFTDRYINAGIDWTGVKGVDVALVYKRDVANHGTISTSNGTMGGTGLGRGTYDEFGLWTQLAF